MAAKLAILLLALALAGCGTVGGARLVKPQLAPIPLALSAGCKPPVAKVGEDARAFAARAVAAFNCEKRDFDNLVAFYNRQARDLAGR